jgi:hypothetical protein
MAVEDEVARQFTGLFATLRASMIQQLFAIWFSLGSYRDPDLPNFLDMSMPLVTAAQETSAQATFTYIQMQLELAGVGSEMDLPPLGDVTGPILRGGVSPEEVYSRPFKELWNALKNGYSYDDAVRMGANRLRQLVETDIQLAHTHAARNVLSSRSDVRGFKRVPTGSYTCALCMIASTQTYRKFDLMPIHPGCDCRVAPIVSDGPTQRVDQETLDRIHKSIEDQFGMSARDARSIDYRKILLVENHGEYGPTLTVAKHKFTGPNDLSAASKEAGSWSDNFSLVSA